MMTLRAGLKDFAKSALYRSGALGLRHARANAQHLTVAMFHRVLDAADPLYAAADPTYTVTPAFFADCLQFFRRHYSVVSAAQVIAARAGGSPLPARPLLITFDDGWQDNLRYAAPVLRQADMPALIFVAADPVASDESFWWQERLFAAVRTNRLGRAEYERIAMALSLPVVPSASGAYANEASWLEIATRLSNLAAAQRAALLTDLPGDAPPVRRLMLTQAELNTLVEMGIEIGAHGASHSPLTYLDDAAADLRRARDVLGQLTGRPEMITTLSFPHGRYNEGTIKAARQSGFALMFTSDYALNPLVGGRPTSDVLGRISIEGPLLADAKGRLRPELLALWLFDRPAFKREAA
jgi:peptidoglycan/xylan/chitin deacetylase (PgdA/CDA1 family)